MGGTKNVMGATGPECSLLTTGLAVTITINLFVNPRIVNVLSTF